MTMQMNVEHKPRHTAMEHAQSTNNKQQAMVHAQNTINTHKPETMSHDTCTSETTQNTDNKPWYMHKTYANKLGHG